LNQISPYLLSIPFIAVSIFFDEKIEKKIFIKEAFNILFGRSLALSTPVANLPPVSLTLVENLPLVSTTPEVPGAKFTAGVDDTGVQSPGIAVKRHICG
jgi:hypothetical protein